MPKMQTSSGDHDALRAVMAHRLNEALASTPVLFRLERGRLKDFAARYALMRTVAQRVLHGTTFPSHALLRDIATDTQLPLDWFYGHYKSIEEARNAHSQQIGIPIYSAPGFKAWLPAPMLPQTETSNFMLVRESTASKESFAREGDYALVERDGKVTHASVHAVIPPKRQHPMFCAVSESLDGKSVTIAHKSFGDLNVPASDLAFGDEKTADESVLVLGRVLGRINFFARGLSLAEM